MLVTWHAFLNLFIQFVISDEQQCTITICSTDTVVTGEVCRYLRYNSPDVAALTYFPRQRNQNMCSLHVSVLSLGP